MLDTLNLRLFQCEAPNTDFLSETGVYLSDVAEHSTNGILSLTGTLGGLKVSLNEHQIRVGDASFCKYCLGDNVGVMGRGDIERGIERLSDALHLPMKKADVTRVDVACNVIVRHPVSVYLEHLGQLRGATRLMQPDSLYYIMNGGQFVLYDKLKELKERQEPIPEAYEGRNLLRIERRYIRRIARQFKRDEVTAATLYDENFYIGLLEGWKKTYTAIEKVNEITLNYGAMKTVRDMNRMGVLALVERAGGQAAMMEQIEENRKTGVINRDQARDLRNKVRDACKADGSLTAPSAAIAELDDKVKRFIRYYR